MGILGNSDFSRLNTQIIIPRVNSDKGISVNELVFTDILAKNISPEAVRFALERISLLEFGLGRMLCNAYSIDNQLLYQCNNWKEVWSRTDVIESIWNDPKIISILKAQSLPTQYLLASTQAAQWVIDKADNPMFLPMKRLREFPAMGKVVNDNLVILDNTSLTEYSFPPGTSNAIVMCISAGGMGGKSGIRPNQPPATPPSPGKPGGDGGLGGIITQSNGSYGASGGGGGGGLRVFHYLLSGLELSLPIHIAKASTVYENESDVTTFGTDGIQGRKFLITQDYIFPFVGKGGKAGTDSSQSAGTGQDGGGNGGQGGQSMGDGSYQSGGGSGAGGFSFDFSRPAVGGNGGNYLNNSVRPSTAGIKYGAGGGGSGTGARSQSNGGIGAQGCIAIILGKAVV